MSQLSPTTLPPPPSTRWALIRWTLCLILCLGVVGMASQYYSHRPSGHFGEHYPLLLSHIVLRAPFSDAYISISWLC